ncbi:hypothetical protein BKI52_43590 [marine bacterium AO1-C]|nr:hypothetical protein BKI52_43590 [marine bacterium AO1-C]
MSSSMNRLDRITAILIQLQSKQLVTATEIAERFDISKRTVYRDIKSLQVAGVPIGVEDGKGYFIVEGYRLPPIQFTEEEANAFMTAEKILSYHTEDSLRKHYESGLMKIKSVLKKSQKDQVNYLNSRTAYQDPWAPKSVYLPQIQHCITSHLVLDLSYHSRYKNEVTQRQVHPYALYFTGVVWTFIGHCQLRNGLREFRTDKIKHLAITNHSFEPDSTFDIGQYLTERAKRKF